MGIFHVYLYYLYNLYEIITRIIKTKSLAGLQKAYTKDQLHQA